MICRYLNAISLKEIFLRQAQVPLLSTATIAGVPIGKFETLNEKSIQDSINEARNKAYQIIRCKGATAHGFASCAMKITESVIENLQRVFELSV